MNIYIWYIYICCRDVFWEGTSWHWRIISRGAKCDVVIRYSVREVNHSRGWKTKKTKTKWSGEKEKIIWERLKHEGEIRIRKATPPVRGTRSSTRAQTLEGEAVRDSRRFVPFSALVADLFIRGEENNLRTDKPRACNGIGGRKKNGIKN